MRTSAAVPPGARLRRRISSCRRDFAAWASVVTVSTPGSWRYASIALASRMGSGPKRSANAIRKSRLACGEAVRNVSMMLRASATPEASPRRDRSCSARTGRSAPDKGPRGRPRSERLRSVSVCSMSLKKDDGMRHASRERRAPDRPAIRAMNDPRAIIAASWGVRQAPGAARCACLIKLILPDRATVLMNDLDTGILEPKGSEFPRFPANYECVDLIARPGRAVQSKCDANCPSKCRSSMPKTTLMSRHAIFD